MSLKEKIDQLLRESLKKRESEKVKVYRLLKSEIKNKEVELMHSLSDEEIYKVIHSMIKKRKESIQQYREGGREDAARAEAEEIDVLEELIPPSLSREEILEIIRATINEEGAQGSRDFGKVMRSVMKKVEGRADGREVNQLVRELLGSS